MAEPGALPLAELALCVLALFASGTVKGVTGIGIPLVSVPIMSLVVTPATAAAVIIVPCVFANVMQLRDGGPVRHHLRDFWPLLAGLVPAIGVGSYWLSTGSVTSVYAVLAALVLGFVALRVLQPELVLPPGLAGPVGFVAGLAAGVVGGMTMLFGPVVLTYLVSLRLGRDRFIGAIAVIYLLCSLVMLAAYLAVGVLDSARALASLGAMLPVLGGVALGRRLRRHVSQRLFERVLLTMLAVIGAGLLQRAWG